MDGLSFGINAPITAPWTNPYHIITTSRTTTTSAISSEKSNCPPLPKAGSWRFSLPSFFSGDCNRYDAVEDNKEESGMNGKNDNWVLRVLQVRSFWNIDGDEQVNNRVQNRDNDEECDACRVDDDDDYKLKFDKDSFSKLLLTVSLAEARLYAKMAYLGSLSYTIPKIKLGNLLKRHRLRYVTSSLEKKAELAAKAKKEKAWENTDSEDQVKQPDLNSPCEWFICDDDDDQGSTRYFVIQGSESIASWQANILFEPIQFEAHDDVIVHRGIYEAAKVVYEQLLPEVREHMERRGAKILLTGHSLGGSLSLLVNLMLLMREEVPRSCLLPVITFGAPWVMCRGDRLLRELGLPTNHLQGITMHRDIVPRAFSCNYPTQLAHILKAINGNFRNHPCLSHQNVLYAPMGEFLILQPDAKVSPSHELLPEGCGLYVLRCTDDDDAITIANKQLTMAAQSVFLNTPHPLEILRDRCAYGSEGGIQRDHDVETYLISIRTVIRQRRTRQHLCLRWHLLNQRQLHLFLYAGREWFASNHMHFICFLRWFIMEACNWITPR